ncbi:aromatic ring-hydroxylating dioxygenase subunit alpha, partial [Paraburkholderia sp. SIMBA_030]
MAHHAAPLINTTKFPIDRWWVAALSSELTDKPVARTLLGRPVVLFRLLSGEVGAL